MRSRSAFFSPPAVAGLALLAIVVGAAFGVRAGFSPTEPDTTRVAGNVIERSEPAVETEAPEVVEDDPIVIPVPAPERDQDDVAAADDDAQDTQAPAPAPAPNDAPVVGIIRDTPPPVIPADDDDRDTSGAEADDDDDEEAPARPRENRNPPSSPRPDPTPEQTNQPAPQSPTPQPEDVALRTGEGHSRDTAIADNGEWLFREVSGHGGQGADSSREAQARVTVAFDDAVKQSTEVVRSFTCRAWVTAGEGRLTTDNDHVFEVALLAIDDDGNVLNTVTSVIERHAYDLGAGQTTEDAPMTTTPVELSAEDGIDYTCGVRYRDR